MSDEVKTQFSDVPVFRISFDTLNTSNFLPFVKQCMATSSAKATEGIIAIRTDRPSGFISTDTKAHAKYYHPSYRGTEFYFGIPNFRLNRQSTIQIAEQFTLKHLKACDDNSENGFILSVSYFHLLAFF